MSRFSVPIRRSIVVLVITFLGAGCATQAQMAAQRIVSNSRAVVAQAEACAAAAYNSPESAPIRPHLPLKVTDATLQQLMDQTRATDEEIKAIYAVYPKVQACQTALLEGLALTTPTIVPILADAYQEEQGRIINLIQRRITWGEYVTTSKSAVLQTDKNVQAAARQIEANLEQSHEAELQRRQAAINAMTQYYRTQQLINSMNRPLNTNCIGMGNMVHCTSN